jgi:hypothetical protein
MEKISRFVWKQHTVNHTSKDNLTRTSLCLWSKGSMGRLEFAVAYETGLKNKRIIWTTNITN